MTWKPYLNNRLIKECDGYFIIKPSNMKDVTPVACPVCDYLFRTKNDEESFSLFGCCESCEIFWARPHQEDWREGWRPTKEEVRAKVGRKKLNVTVEF